MLNIKIKNNTIIIIIKITTAHPRIKLIIMGVVVITKINITINHIITSKYLIIMAAQCPKDLGIIQWSLILINNNLVLIFS